MENTPESSSRLSCDGSKCLERRKSVSSRRKREDRRSEEERRFDSRVAAVALRKAIKSWFRSLTRSRLGVDRRKKRDRRKIADRRQQLLRSVLTPEEIADLLS